MVPVQTGIREFHRQVVLELTLQRDVPLVGVTRVSLFIPIELSTIAAQKHPLEVRVAAGEISTPVGNGLLISVKNVRLLSTLVTMVFVRWMTGPLTPSWNLTVEGVMNVPTPPRTVFVGDLIREANLAGDAAEHLFPDAALRLLIGLLTARRRHDTAAR